MKTIILFLSATLILFCNSTAQCQNVVMEFGKVQASGILQTVSLNHAYTSPIVIIGPVKANPVISRVSSVTSTSFDIFFEQTSGASLQPGSVTYLVIEEGEHLFPNGSLIQAGKTTSNDESFQSVGFTQSFSNIPAVFTQIQTDASNTNALRTRIRNKNLSTFEVKLEQEELVAEPWMLSVSETVGFMALEEGCIKIQDIFLQVYNSIEDLNHLGRFQGFEENCGNPSFNPMIFGNLQTYNDPDPAILHLGGMYRALLKSQSGIGFVLHIEVLEDQSLDSEITHGNEGHASLVIWEEEGLSIIDPSEPTLVSAYPSLGPTTGEIPIILQGTHLDLLGSSPSILFDGVSIPNDNISVFNPLEILFTLPSGSGVNKNIELSGNSYSFVLNDIFSYAPPSISSATTSSQGTEGGYNMEILGSDFGNNPGNLSVTLDGVALPVLALDHNNITCLVPAGGGKNKDLIVTVSGQSDTLLNVFSYDSPNIVAVNPTESATIGGVTMDIFGSNFGNSAGIVQVLIGPYQATINSISNTQIEAIIPSGVGSNLDVLVIVENDTSLLAQAFSYSNPMIIGVASGPKNTQGNQVVIEGLNFGSFLDSITVTLEGENVQVINVNHSDMTIQTLPGTGTGKTIVATVAGDSSSGGEGVFSYDPPNIVQIDPNFGPTQGQNSVQIYGSNFGNDENLLSATIGGNPALIQMVSHDQMEVIVPPGVGADQTLIVNVDGQSGTLNNAYSYSAPVMQGLSNNCLEESGTISILGSNFGESSAASVKINGVEAPSSNVSQNEISMTLPANLQATNTIEVSVGSQVSNSLVLPICDPKLAEISGSNLLINSLSGGLYFKSPDGSCWKLHIGNNGIFKSQSVPCPIVE